MARIQLDGQQVTEAETTLQQALEIYEESHLHHKAVEPLALLSEIDLLSDRLQIPHKQSELLYEFLKDQFPTDTLNPLELYWICYRVLDSLNDPRGHSILERAYTRIQLEASNVPDQTFRESYLQNVMTHRELVEAIESLGFDNANEGL